MPDDVLVYGFLVDGYTELGRYAEAEKAAQWMLDLRPGNVPGLTRAAYLRELFGDHEGAVELMDTAYRRTAHAEVEDRAWILTQIAHLSLLTCRTGPAEALLTEALKLFPDYHYALAQMAELRAAQGRLRRRPCCARGTSKVAPHPENRYELGAALARAGKSADARGRVAGVRDGGSRRDERLGQRQRRAHLLLRGPRRAACRGTGHRQARGGAPPRRQDARGPRLGAPGERPIERSED